MTRSNEVKTLLIRWWGWFLLATLIIATMIAQRYLITALAAEGTAAALFRGAMLIAHLGALSFLALSPALLLTYAWPQTAAVKGLSIGLASAFLILLLMDTQVYQLYRFHIDAGVLNLLFGGAASETFVFPAVMYWQGALIVVLLSAMMASLGWSLWRMVQRTNPRPALTRALLAVYLCCLLSFHGVHIWADARAREELTGQTDILPVRYAATAKRLMRRVGMEVRADSLSARGSDDSSLLTYPLQTVECEAPNPRPNIVVIVIDSWRFDAMNAQTTPNIDRFAQRSSVFTDHYSGGNATRVGLFSLFYSIPGTYWHQALSERRGPVFIGELLEQDFEIGIFRSAPLTSPEFDRTVFADVVNPRLRSEGEEPADWDLDLTEDFLTFLQQRRTQQPFFSLLFYDAPHSFDFPKGYPAPFQPSLKDINYFRLDENTDPLPFFNRYLNSVHYVDSLVGKALGAIEAEGLLKNTFVLITSDHGQEFNETGGNYWGHNSNYSRYQTGVPFIWYSPHRGPAVFHHRSSHFDVMPALMQEALGCEFSLDAISVGHPLFEPAVRDVLVMSQYSDFAIVQPDMITEVRKSGVMTVDLEYRPLEDAPDPKAVADALEQKSRFYKPARLARDVER